METQTKIPSLTVSNPWWGHDPSDKQWLGLYGYEDCPDLFYGGASNQLELPREVVSFFQIDPTDQDSRRQIVLTNAGMTWNNSFMAYYVRNGMWRINLDTDIPEVAARTLGDRFIRLRRTAQPDTYEFRVSTANSIQALRTASIALGNVRTTPSREYGWV